MKRGRKLLVIAVAAVALVAVVVPLYSFLTEPQYKGKRASEWFLEFRKGTQTPGYGWTIQADGRHMYVNGGERHDPAKDALRALGPSAARYLERQLNTNDSWFRACYRSAYTNIPLAVRTLLPAPADPALRVDAVTALAGLGTNAQPAIPKIVDIVIAEAQWHPYSLYPYSSLIDILSVLHASQNEYDRILLSLNKKNDVGVKALLDHARVQTAAAAAALGRIVEREQDRTPAWVFEYLRGFDAAAIEVLPILIDRLASKNSEIRYQVVRTIETIGPAASSAEVALQKLLTDENEMVRSAVRRSLEAIRAKDLDSK
jgi:hypothetical protein